MREVGTRQGSWRQFEGGTSIVLLIDDKQSFGSDVPQTHLLSLPPCVRLRGKSLERVRMVTVPQCGSVLEVSRVVWLLETSVIIIMFGHTHTHAMPYFGKQNLVTIVRVLGALDCSEEAKKEGEIEV